MAQSIFSDYIRSTHSETSENVSSRSNGWSGAEVISGCANSGKWCLSFLDVSLAIYMLRLGRFVWKWNDRFNSVWKMLSTNTVLGSIYLFPLRIFETLTGSDSFENGFRQLKGEAILEYYKDKRIAANGLWEFLMFPWQYTC